MAQLVVVTVRMTTMEQASGSPVTVPKAGAKVFAELSAPTWEDDEIIVPTLVKGLTDVNGQCVVMLYANEAGGNPTNYKITMHRAKTDKQTMEVTAVIPAGVSSVDLADCLVPTGTYAGGGNDVPGGGNVDGYTKLEIQAILANRVHP